MSYNIKNYTEQGGESIHIGGELIVEEGASVKGLLSAPAENQAASSSTTAAALRNDFNALLTKLKNAGLMVPDAWSISAALAPSPSDTVVAANNALVDSVDYSDGVITVTVDVNALTESTSSAPGQGTHKWLCLGIGTGLSAITDAKYNGDQLTAADVSEATACGCDAGTFVLWIKAEVVAAEGKVFTLDADGYAQIPVSVAVVAPAQAEN